MGIYNHVRLCYTQNLGVNHLSYLMKHSETKPTACSEQWAGRLGSVTSVTILNMAAVGSYSYQGGSAFSISKTVAPVLLVNQSNNETR